LVINGGGGPESLEIYRLALDLSALAWTIYLGLTKEFRYAIGGQFLESVDSIGANIAEGFGRYHYKDSLKFYYNSRGSLLEAKHWLTLLRKRELAPESLCNDALKLADALGKKLNNFINSLKALT
jgi:four helix bundle protein